MNRIKRVGIITILPIFIIVLLTSCDVLKMDYQPTAEQIQNRLGSLIIYPYDIIGIYAHKDVDSLLFTYKSKNEKVKSASINQLYSEDWTVQYVSDNEMVANKIKPTGKGESSFYSLETVKISINPTGWLCVGYLQIDTKSKPDIGIETVETKWALENLWPRYELCKKS